MRLVKQIVEGEINTDPQREKDKLHPLLQHPTLPTLDCYTVLVVGQLDTSSSAVLVVPKEMSDLNIK